MTASKVSARMMELSKRLAGVTELLTFRSSYELFPHVRRAISTHDEPYQIRAHHGRDIEYRAHRTEVSIPGLIVILSNA